jgi:hypothetical protein
MGVMNELTAIGCGHVTILPISRSPDATCLVDSPLTAACRSCVIYAPLAERWFVRLSLTRSGILRSHC